MRDKFNTYYGARETLTPDEQPVITRVPAMNEGLYNIVSLKGDFKKPLQQQYTRYVERYMIGNSDTYYANGKHGYLHGVYTAVPASPNAVFDARARDKALENLYDQIRGNVDLSIDLYQIKSTQATVLKLWKATESLTKTFRRIKRSNPRDWGSQWLEYVYGIKPTLQTVFDGLDRAMKPSTIWYDLRARASTRDRSRDSIEFGYPGIVRTLSSEISSRCEIRAKFALSGSTLESLAGFTSLNPASFAWEAMPYSFVVDWVLDVGGYLRSMESGLLYGPSFVSGYETRTCKHSIQALIKGNNVDQDGTTRVWDFVGETYVVTKQRFVLASAPLPDRPHFSVELGATRLLNAAALLSQHLKS